MLYSTRCGQIYRLLDKTIISFEGGKLVFQKPGSFKAYFLTRDHFDATVLSGGLKGRVELFRKGLN